MAKENLFNCINRLSKVYGSDDKVRRITHYHLDTKDDSTFVFDEKGKYGQLL